MAYTDSQIRSALEVSPIAGGDAYTPAQGKLDPRTADVEVSTVRGLKNAITGNGRVIAVADGSYDMTGEQIEIGDDTIVGYRGWNGSDGAYFHTNSGGRMGPFRYYRMFHIRGSGRLSGIQMHGHDPYNSFARGDYDTHLACAVKIRGRNAEVDNVRAWGFPWNSIHGHGTASRIATANIHHNHLYRNYQIGYGYGVDFWRGWGHVHHNYLNGQRHSIDGFGHWNCGYLCENNIFGPEQYSHTVDMHCLTENRASNSSDPNSRTYHLRAGGKMVIRNNTFCFTNTNAIGLRGFPYEGIEIYNNRFAHRSRPSRNPNTHRGTHVWYANNMNWSGVSRYPPKNSEGYPANWTDRNNQFGANASNYSSEYGAPLNIYNPPATPEYPDTPGTPDVPRGPIVDWADLDAGQRRAIARQLGATTASFADIRHATRPAHATANHSISASGNDEKGT
jgi:hypothetical protein